MNTNKNIDFFGNSPAQAQAQSSVQSNEATASFMSSVFTYMTGALAISGVLAYVFAHSAGLLSMIVSQQGGLTLFGWVATLSPLIFVLVMNFGLEKLSSTALLGLFIAFAGMMGISLSTIFLTYAAGTIYQTFAITAVTFGVMALLGYTTSTDLTKFGSLLMMAVVGLIIAMVVNMFLGSALMDYIISIFGVFIFTGLTAYDTQRLKRIGSGEEYGAENRNKLAIMGSLSLYLNFINLFLFLLRLLGGGRD